jgi:hypothetical protein
MAESASVKVFARFRPYNGREKEIGLKDQRHFIKFDGTENVQLGTHSFTFDHIFGMDSQQDQLYGQSTFPMVEDVMAGYNGTLFAYGQTGAGKSFSMMGPDNCGENEAMWGMIPRATRQIFEYIAKAPMEVTFSLSVSYLEVYREVIRDLLDPSKNNLSVRESPSQGIYVDGASVSRRARARACVYHAVPPARVGSATFAPLASATRWAAQEQSAEPSVAAGGQSMHACTRECMHESLCVIVPSHPTPVIHPAGGVRNERGGGIPRHRCGRCLPRGGLDQHERTLLPLALALHPQGDRTLSALVGSGVWRGGAG